MQVNTSTAERHRKMVHGFDIRWYTGCPLHKGIIRRLSVVYLAAGVELV